MNQDRHMLLRARTREKASKKINAKAWNATPIEDSVKAVLYSYIFSHAIYLARADFNIAIYEC